jgi:hypothetical protein
LDSLSQQAINCFFPLPSPLTIKSLAGAIILRTKRPLMAHSVIRGVSAIWSLL